MRDCSRQPADDAEILRSPSFLRKHKTVLFNGDGKIILIASAQVLKIHYEL